MVLFQLPLKNNEKEDWLNRWACGSTGRVMFKEMAQPRPQDAINQLDGQDQSLIFQFRTQHTRKNQHLNRINPLHQPHCRHCDNPAETTEHLLLYCPNLQFKRKELLPTNPTIHSTLYGQLDQLKKTSTFIRLALTVQEWRTQQFGINNNNNNILIPQPHQRNSMCAHESHQPRVFMGHRLHLTNPILNFLGPYTWVLLVFHLVIAKLVRA